MTTYAAEVHPKIVERIAKTYLEQYRILGYKQAAEYIERVVDGNVSLHASVRKAVKELVRSV
jgi:hypothetical protein